MADLECCLAGVAELADAADYYKIDPIDLSKRIIPYDDATGYPYQK